MAEWKPKSFQPSTFKEDVSGLESFVRGAYQGAGMGFADEGAGALDAIGGHLKRTFTNDWKGTGGGLWEDIKAEAGQVADDYRKGRDESRRAYAAAQEANPAAYGVGQFGGAVGTGFLTGGATALGQAGLKGALTAGALEGAASGLGGSEADLTHADLDAYAKAFRDSTEGGLTGAGFGAGFYGAGKGLKWVGGKALSGLRRARGELEAGVSAEREAADEVARAAEEQAAGRLVKDEYAARQQNARMDRASKRQAAIEAAKRAREEARATREAERAAQQEGRAQSAAERESDRFSEARTTVDKGLRNLDQENQAAAAEAERMAARQERQAAAVARESDRFANARTSVDRNLRDLHRENQAAARAAARPPLRVVRNPPASGPMEDPNTAILGGYRGKAGERRAVNYDRVRQYRQDIADPNFTGDRARLEQYAREYGDAVDNPGAFERRMVERYLRENYPPEVADRILRDRVGPNGEILPRRTSQAASSPETPQGMAPPRPQPFDYSEADRLINELRRPGQPPARDYSDESVARIIREARPEPATQHANIGEIAEAMGENPRYLRQRDSGLGAQDLGAARWGDETFAYPNADIRRSQQPSGDPFHDAPTRAALIRTSPEGGIQGLTENPLHQFEFRDPKTGKDFSASFEVDPSNPDVVHLNYVGPAGVDPRHAMMAGYDASKNVLGAGTVKQIAAEAARAFPGAKRMSAWRMTGANADRNMEIRLPEVTQVGDALPTPSRAPYVDPDARTMVEPNVRDLLPPANPNARRTAGIYEVPLSELDDVPAAGARKPVAAAEVRRALDMGEELPPVRVGQGPDGLRELEDGNHRLAAYRERGTPNVWAQFESDAAAQVNPNRARGTSIFNEAVAPIDSRPLPENPALLRQRERGFGSQNMGAARYGDETIAYPNRDIIRSQEAMGDVTQAGREPPVSMEDLRQWTGTPDAPRAPEGLPPLEELTQPGAPSFTSDVRRAQPFQAPPQLRPEYQPRPPEPRPVFDEAMAERRAMGANAQAGAGGVPTRNLSPARPAPAYNPNNSMVSPRDFDAETVVPLGDTQVPRSPRPAPYEGPAAPELAPEPMQVNPLRQARPRPLAPPVAPPAQTVMGAPPGSLVRQARPSVGEIAQQREQDALGDVVRAGWEGARDANNALAAPFGAAYGIGKEALQNPAVRARAISLFRLDRLARVRPEVWARVGPTLQRALQAGPERFKAERHVLLLRDPEFRAAEAEADAELERMDGQPPARRAAGL